MRGAARPAADGAKKLGNFLFPCQGFCSKGVEIDRITDLDTVPDIKAMFVLSNVMLPLHCLSETNVVHMTTYLQSGASGCKKGFVKCFLKVSLAAGQLQYSPTPQTVLHTSRKNKFPFRPSQSQIQTLSSIKSNFC